MKDALKCRYCGTDLQTNEASAEGSSKAGAVRPDSESVDSEPKSSSHANSSPAATKKLAISAAIGGGLILVIGVAFASSSESGDSGPTYETAGQCGILDQHICPEDFPVEVTEIVSQMKAGGFPCENAFLYPDNGSNRSEIRWSSLTCNYYWNSEDDYFFGHDIDIYESPAQLDTHFQEPCFTSPARVAPTVIFYESPLGGEEGLAAELAEALEAYSTQVNMGDCGSFKYQGDAGS